MGNEKKKILLLMPELFHGGAEKQFREIISRINKQHFSVFVIISNSYSNDNEEIELEFIRENPDVEFFFLNGLHENGNTILRYISAFKLNCKVVPLLKQIKPDIVLVYTLLGLKISYLCKLRGLKVIFSERNSGEYPYRFYRNNNIFLKSLSEFICNSKPAQENIKENGINAKYIPNGIMESEILPLSETDVYEIVVPARIARVKNQEIVIHAASLLKDDNIKIRFIGKTEDSGYLKQLNELATSLGVEKRIEFATYTTDIIDIYRNSDLIILPSISEGFSNVLLESYMYGRLCLASDIPMNKEVGSDCQRFFAIDDPDNLAIEILRIKNMEKAYVEKEIVNNHNYVTQNFSINTMVYNYQKLFNILTN